MESSMEQSFQEFRQIAGIKKGTKHKISGSFGVYDVYKKIRKNNWYNIGRPVTEHEFYTIIRSVNNKLAEEVGKGKEIKFPYSMGALELRKSQRGVTIKNGKLKITYPVDWDKTLKAWYENEEMREKKILIRDESPFLYRVQYRRNTAKFENKIFYKFALNRFIKVALKEKIKKGEIDTLW
jgi:hypothetical protein